MSRRQLSLVVVTIASLVVTACGSSPTAPQRTGAPNASQFDATPVTPPPALGTTGSGG